MPLYEYQCENCKKVFEKLVRTAEDEKNLTCPICDSPYHKRLLGSLAHFKMKEKKK